MTWFKVDDGLHAHSKVVRAGVHAMGLWVIAGAWSSDQLTDGWIPDHMAARMDREYKKHAAQLVAAGLWYADALPNGDQGWRFHQWADHQPSSESVKAKREEARERMRRVRGSRKPSPDEQAEDGSQDVRANTDGTLREVRLAPTRPDPKRTTTKGPYVAQGRDARELDVPPDEGRPGPAEQIVTKWVSGLNREPQRRIVEQIGTHVAEALRDGCDPADVDEALTLWQDRGTLGPSALPSLIHQITNPPKPGTNVVSYIGRASPPRPSTTDQRVSEALAAGRAVQAQLEGNAR